MKLREIFQSRMVNNGIWLYVLQAFNTLIPLLTLPYITRVLGAEQYGIFSKLLNIVLYAQAIVEYGFNLTGAKKIAINNDQRHVDRVFSRIFVSKLVLFFFSIFFLIIFLVFYPIKTMEFIVLLILIIIVFSETLKQTWIFHGLQDMKFITIVTVTSRVISIVMIFVFIKDSNDLFLYSVFYAITYLLISVFSTLIVRYRFKIRLVNVKFFEVIEELKEGWYLFTSSASSRIFVSVGITALTFVVSDKEIGMFSAIQKIPFLLGVAYAPIGLVIFPYMSNKFNTSIETGLRTIISIIKAILTITLVILVCLFVFREKIIILLYGEEFLEFKDLIFPLGIGFLFSITNNLLGIQTLVASGMQKFYSIGFNLSTLLLIVLTFSLVKNYGAYGVAFSSLVAEALLTIFNIFFIYKILFTQIKKNS